MRAESRFIQKLGGKLRRRVLLSVRWVNILQVRIMMMRFQLYGLFPIVAVIPLLSCVQLLVSLWTSACQDSPVPTISWSLPKFISIESVMLFNHLILCCCLLLLPSKGMPPFPASGSFPVTRLLASGAQRLGLQHQSFQ